MKRLIIGGVSTGMFGLSQSFAPLRGADWDGSDIRLKYSKDVIKDAPRIENEGHLERDEERRLYQHFGLTEPTTMPREDYDRTLGERQAAGAARRGERRDDRREDRRDDLVEQEKRWLRRFSTHTETVDVPITKEKVVVERSEASGGGKLTGERTTVGEGGKERIPVEDIHISKERETTTERVNVEVQADAESERGLGRNRPKR